MAALFKSARQEMGGCNVLINNAGILRYKQPHRPRVTDAHVPRRKPEPLDVYEGKMQVVNGRLVKAGHSALIKEELVAGRGALPRSSRCLPSRGQRASAATMR